MTTIRIYQPSKTTMQSGKGKSNLWRVEFETQDPFERDPLMGWMSSRDTLKQLRLYFSSLEKAIDFAKEKGDSYTIYNPTEITSPPKSYETNFTCVHMRGFP